MAKNMGSADRIIRTVLGIAFIVVAALAGGWFWILGALGVVFLATSLMSTCPLYMPFGLSTRRKAQQ
ncbi:MAG: DUF2892 domain-containing protein [Spirochaetes bacterium]|jgi:hypothetical protein|nr:DUF2892 domain-containing protein [Spirochaetota bacterium]